MNFHLDIQGLSLGDKRLDRRGWQMSGQIAKKAGASFPNLFRTEAELEAVYRWFGHEEITSDKILAPHVGATASRVAASGSAIVIHDTMDVETSKNVGFRQHHSLAISDCERKIPLGIVNVISVLRHPRAKKKKGAPNERNRWLQGIKDVRRVLGPQASIVHVADCEIDAYEIIAGAVLGGETLVFRLQHDRLVAAEGLVDATKLSVLAGQIKVVATRDVKLSPRKRGNKSAADLGTHPIRASRQAHLEIGATKVTFNRPPSLSKELPSELTLNFVSVTESNPPTDAEPVEWLLATNLPIDTTEQVLKVVDIYRARWTIEEFHKGLKTGCSLEARQLESQHAMLNVAALMIPIALDLLAIKTLAKISPEAPASSHFPELRLKVLAHFSPLKLGAEPTLREAMLAIAKLGGHIKNNGEPGWIVLTRGYQELLMCEAAWEAGQKAQKM